MNKLLGREKLSLDAVNKHKNKPIIGYQLRSSGRPPKYIKEYSNLAFIFAEAGLRQCDSAKSLGISLSTFKNWLNKYEDFGSEWKRGCLLADAEVARALYKLAVGHEEYTIKSVQLEDGTYELKKYIVQPPNLRACKLWLRNRQPKLWK